MLEKSLHSQRKKLCVIITIDDIFLKYRLLKLQMQFIFVYKNKTPYSILL